MFDHLDSNMLIVDGIGCGSGCDVGPVYHDRTSTQQPGIHTIITITTITFSTSNVTIITAIFFPRSFFSDFLHRR